MPGDSSQPNPVIALVRMAIRTQAVSQSRRSGYYRPPQQQQPTRPRIRYYTSLDTFAARTPSSSRCVCRIKDPIGNEFLLIPLSNRGSQPPTWVGLVRLRRVAETVSPLMATVVTDYIANRARASADHIDRSLGQRVAWHVVIRSVTSGTDRVLAADELGRLFRRCLNLSSSNPQSSALPRGCGIESGAARAA